AFALHFCIVVFFFQAEDGIRDLIVTGVQTCALPISFWPFLPIASESWLSGTMTSVDGWPSGSLAAVITTDDTFAGDSARATNVRSEEHTSELQSRSDLVCRLLLEKKNASHYTK